MTKNNSKKLTILCCLLLFGLYVFTKSYLRTLHFDSTIIKIIIGSFPNFTAATAIPLALCVDLYKAKSISELTKSNRTISILMVIITIILISEEFFPLVSGSKVFDIWDIVFSLIGMFLSFVYKAKITTLIKRQLPLTEIHQ